MERPEQDGIIIDQVCPLVFAPESRCPEPQCGGWGSHLRAKELLRTWDSSTERTVSNGETESYKVTQTGR